MKLFGNRKGGRHAGSRTDFRSNGNIGTSVKADPSRTRHFSASSGGKPPIPKWKKRLIIATAVTFGILLTFGVGLYAFYRTAVVPPEVRDTLRSPDRRPGAAAYQDAENPSTGLNPGGRRPAGASGVQVEREDNVFTFLVFGLDDWNTDTIMAVTFNATNYTLDIVNIPRDTLVNVAWNIKRANSIYGAMHSRYRREPNSEELIREAVIDKFADVLGFAVDFMVMVDMRGFVRLVDAIGGVDFYVPVNMFYEDPYQDLVINIRRGQQRLDGRQALNAVRFRSFANADIGRIGTQQDFLMAAATQILQNSSSINVTDMATIFLRYVETDLTLGNLLYFGRAFLRMDAENINFHMMPHRLEWIAGSSYVSIILDEWIEMVNEVLSPWDIDLVAEDFSILTRDPDGALFVTDGNWAGNQNWGRGSPAPRPAQQPAAAAPAPQAPQPRPSDAALDETDPDEIWGDGDEEFEPPYDSEPPDPDEIYNLPPDDPYPDAVTYPHDETPPPPPPAYEAPPTNEPPPPAEETPDE